MSIAPYILAALDGPEITPLIEELILKDKILGFVLFKRNIQSAEQLIELNRQLRSLSHRAGYKILLAVDQEGGRVARLVEPDFSHVPPMRTLGNLYQQTGKLEAIYQLGKVLGSEVSAAGFNLDFAPTVDVDINADSPIIGDRSFSGDHKLVAQLAAELIKGLQSENVLPCLKHFPGHGATTEDSHFELPTDPRCLKDLQKTDLSVYESLIRQNLAPSIMTAHVIYPDLDTEFPATLSQKIIGTILRTSLGYDGVVFSDDLLMKAVIDHYSLFDASRRFFLCGGDAVLVCKHPEMTRGLIDEWDSFLDNTNSVETEKLKNNLLKSAQRINRLKSQLVDPNATTQMTKLKGLVAANRDYIKQLFSNLV